MSRLIEQLQSTSPKTRMAAVEELQQNIDIAKSLAGSLINIFVEELLNTHCVFECCGFDSFKNRELVKAECGLLAEILLLCPNSFIESQQMIESAVGIAHFLEVVFCSRQEPYRSEFKAVYVDHVSILKAVACFEENYGD